jgi:hypothetical protein
MSTITTIDAYGREHPLEDVLPCIGKGWHNLVRELAVDLIALGWDRHLYQLKEKFGGLRFYIGEATDEIFDLIAKAEEKSFKICERCGAPGKLRNDGWLRTLCENCAHHKERSIP